MEQKLTFQYDRTADILYISTCKPYPEQESEEMGDDIIARLNPGTNAIENLEVLFFQHDSCGAIYLSCQFWPTFTRVGKYMHDESLI